jgi:hypothetical protein
VSKATPPVTKAAKSPREKRAAAQALKSAAVKAANEALWKAHPELKGRQLTMEPKDAALRKEWMQSYNAALTPRKGPVGEPIRGSGLAVAKAGEKLQRTSVGTNKNSSVQDEIDVGTDAISEGLIVAKRVANYIATSEFNAGNIKNSIDYGRQADEFDSLGDALGAATFVVGFGVDAHNDYVEYKNSNSENLTGLYADVSKTLAKDAAKAAVDGIIIDADTSSGIVLGAEIGTVVCPGLGTAIGAGVGGTIGFGVGYLASKKCDNMIDDAVDTVVNRTGDVGGSLLYKLGWY